MLEQPRKTPNGRNGQIITFYSYKGGTGRSMAVANIAWILASRGKRVLVVDWDLEAPGLHRYFRPFLADQDLFSSDGVIDLAVELATRAAHLQSGFETTTAIERGDPNYSQVEEAPQTKMITQYALPLTWTFGNDEGALDFLPAGRQGPAYATKVNAFDWQTFYQRLGGEGFLDRLKAEMRIEYDYTLIDSRTGVSDTAGICTIHLPDTLVVCFTLNNQSIEGASSVAASIQSQRTTASKHGFIRFVPVPMRVQAGEKEKLELRQHMAVQIFTSFLDGSQGGNYFDQVEVPYDPFYDYEEVLATFADRPGNIRSVLAAYERLTAQITRGEIDGLVPPDSTQREHILREFSSRYLVSKLPEVAPVAVEDHHKRSATWVALGRWRWLATAALALLLVSGLFLWYKSHSRLISEKASQSHEPFQTNAQGSSKNELVFPKIIHGSISYLSAVLFSPDGEQLITAGGGEVSIWQVSGGQLIRKFRIQPPVTAAVDANGSLFIGDGNGQILSCQLKFADCVALKTGTRSAITALAASSRNVFAALSNGGFLWSQNNGKEFLLARDPTHVRSIAASPRLAAASTSDKVWIQNIASERPLSIATDSVATSLAFEPGKPVLAVGTESGRVLFFDAIGGRLLNEFRRQDKSVTSVAFDPSGRLLAVSTLSPEIHVYDVYTGELLSSVNGGWGPVYALSFSPDGSTLAAACSDGTARLWRVSSSFVSK